MKNLVITCLTIGLAALIARADPAVTATPKTKDLGWFDVTTSATNGGAFTVSGDATCEVQNNQFVIDSDLENRVTFTNAVDNLLTQAMSKVSFTLDASVVPQGSLQTPDSQHAKVAFALYQASEEQTNFVAWVGGQDWVTLTGAAIPDENTSYIALVEFDNRASDKYVRFSVGPNASSLTVLTNSAAAEWISYGTAAITNVVSIDFVGCGKVAAFTGKQLEVIAEIVPISGKGSVEVKKEDVAAFKKAIEGTSYTSVDQFLAADAKTAFSGTSFQDGLKVGEAYALGLVEKDGTGKMVAKDNGAIKVEAVAQASVTDGIPVTMNITPPAAADTGATITYQLQGSTTGAAESYVSIGNVETSVANVKIPVANVGSGTGKYRYFKVVTTVTLKDAPSPTND